jgi:hypothetical protein
MIDFPSSPTIGQTLYVPSNGITYRWDGTLWLAGPNVGPGYGSSGDFCATSSTYALGVANAWATLMPPVIVSGNAGSWYNPANGRYTPPPGRYYLEGTFTGSYSSALHFYIALRKNGVIVQNNLETSGAASWYANLAISLVVDANGTDWFDLQVYCISAGGTVNNFTFLAYPIAGAKGPPGDKGATGDLGNLAALHLHDNAEVTTGTPLELRVTIPLNAKKIEFSFFARCSTVVDANLCFQWMQGSTPLNANSYYGQYLYGTTSTPGTAPIGPLTYWSIGGLMYWGGSMNAYLTGDATGIPNFIDASIMGSATNGSRYAWHETMYTGISNAQITGLRMFYSAGQAFALGSFLRTFSIN